MRFLLPAFLLLLACDRPLRPLDYHLVMKNLSWLEGSWQGEYQGKPFYERWTRSNDTLLINETYDDKKSPSAEGINATIEVLDGQVYYTNPNSGKKLTWSLADSDAGRVRFTNPQAPYSQTIVFEHTADDRWRATLVTKGDTTVYLLRRQEF